MRAYVKACRKGCKTTTDVTHEKFRKMRGFFEACRKRYETGSHVTQLKRNKITDISEKKGRMLRCAEKGARLALM